MVAEYNNDLPDKYLNPFTDYGFKKLFGEPVNKALLLDFLNELLREEQGEIKDLTYLKTEHLGSTDLDRKAIFDQLFETAEIAKFTPEQRISYEDSLKYYRDLKNSLDTAFDEGMEEGLAKGEEIGEKKGIALVAKRLIAADHDDAFISGITGLSAEEIQQLRREMGGEQQY